MLKNLKIINGNMPLEFDSLNTIYTVNVDSNEVALDIRYEIDNNVKVSICNNNLKYDKTEIVLTVFNDEDMQSYYLYAFKDNTQNAANITQFYSDINIEKNEISPYAAPVISSICFLIIIIAFTLLFKKSKKIKFCNKE